MTCSAAAAAVIPEACYETLSAGEGIEKFSDKNTPVFFNFGDFMAERPDAPDTGCPLYLLISGPVVNGSLLLRTVRLEEGIATPAALLATGLTVETDPPDRQTAFSWSASADGITYLDMGDFKTEAGRPLDYEAFLTAYSNRTGRSDFAYVKIISVQDNTRLFLHDVPVEALSYRAALEDIRVEDNLVFDPEKDFSGLATFDYRIVLQVSSDVVVASGAAAATIGIGPHLGPSKADASAVPTPKNYKLNIKQGLNATVGKTLKALVSKTVERIRFTDSLPKSDIGALTTGSTQLEAGQEIPVSQLTALNFKIADKYYFGDLYLKWQALRGSSESGTATLTLHYINVPDPPTTANTSREISRGATYTFSADDFSFESKDNDTFQRIKIKTIPDKNDGYLTYNGNSNKMKKAGQIIPVSMLGRLVFHPASTTYVGTADFDFYVGTSKLLSKSYATFLINVEGSLAATTPSLRNSSDCASMMPGQHTWSWNPLSGATSYDVRVDGDDNSWISISNGVEYDSDNLSVGQHTFYLRAKNGVSTSKSYTCTFDIVTDLSQTAPDLTGNASATTSTKPIWTWPAVPGATSYSVQINNGVMYSVGNPTFTSLETLPAGSSYTLTVWANNALSHSNPAKLEFAVVSSLASVVPSLTVNYYITSKIQPTWSWNTASGATSYEVKIDSGNWTSVGNALAYTSQTALDAGDHTFSLRAVNAANSATQPVSDNFTIGTVPQSVALPVVSPFTEAGSVITGTLDLTNVFVDPAGYAVTVTASDYASLMDSISIDGNTLTWSSTRVGQAAVQLHGDSTPNGGSYTTDKSFTVTINAQATTLGAYIKEPKNGNDLTNGKITPDQFTVSYIDNSGQSHYIGHFYIPISGISNSLLTDSQIKDMITISYIGSSVGNGAVNSSITNATSWVTDKTNGWIDVLYAVTDPTKCDPLRVDKYNYTYTTSKSGMPQASIVFSIGSNCP